MTGTSRPLRALIIDDEPDNRLILRERLRDVPGWEVSVGEAADGSSALAALRESLYDAAFLDVRLPDIHGIKLLEQIRQLHPKVAVIVTSAAGSERTAVDAMKRGAIDYLTRDELRRTDLAQLLRRAVEMQFLQSENLELRQVNRMKDEFISSASHELRTPLAVILGYAKTLEDGDLGDVNETQKRALQAIRRRGDALLDMLNRLLSFREARYDAQQVLLRPTDLGGFLAEHLEERWAAPPRDLKIESAVSADPVWVLADRDRLKEAVENLVSNAVKFSPDGGKVSVELRSHEGREAWVRVTDAGRGIPPEVLPRLFDGFTHTDSDLTREVSGLGLGLALTRQIMDLHGGRVWLDSDGEGRGTTATLALPLAEPDTRHVVVERKRDLDKRRVLVCEDNADIVEIVRLFVAGFSANLELVTAFTGHEAVEQIAQRRFDLLVLDVMLPDMNGLEVLARVNRLPDEKRPPVLMLSGHQEAARTAVRQGAKDFLMKPFTKEDFLARVLGILGIERRGRSRPR